MPKPGLRWLTRRARDRGEGRADRSLARPSSAATGRRRSTQFGPAIWAPFAGAGARRHRRRRQAADARSVPRQERDSRRSISASAARTASSRSRICPSAPSEWARLDTEVDRREPGRAGAERQVAGAVAAEGACSDPTPASQNARRFKSYDDFEEMGIHSTILIDKDGRVYWAQARRRAVRRLQVPRVAVAADESEACDAKPSTRATVESHGTHRAVARSTSAVRDVLRAFVAKFVSLTSRRAFLTRSCTPHANAIALTLFALLP